MKHLVLILALSLGAIPVLHAEPEKNSKTRPAEPAIVDVETLALWMSAKSVTIIDANSVATRMKEGFVPGARLLPHYERYDVARELPADKNARLVFYCSHNACRAADGAAETARKAGFSNLNILRVGIAGWRSAGQATAKLTPTL